MQRGKGVFDKSIHALLVLNSLGYGKLDDLQLDLVYNPLGKRKFIRGIICPIHSHSKTLTRITEIPKMFQNVQPSPPGLFYENLSVKTD